MILLNLRFAILAKARTSGRKFPLLLYCMRLLCGAMAHVNQFYGRILVQCVNDFHFSSQERWRTSFIENRQDFRRKDRPFQHKGIAYAKTVAEAMNLKRETDNPADREKLRRSDFVGEKCRSKKGIDWNSLVLFVLIISAKPGWTGAASQRLLPTP